MSTTRKRHTPLSHSARETWKQCPRKFHFQYNMRMEPVEKKSSLKMGIAFSEALEHRDPSRTAEGYWRDTPLHDRIMDRTAETEIAQVELLSELYLERYADDVAPGRIWTPEFEFKSELLGRGFLDAIIEESNGREGSCPVHGEGQREPGEIPSSPCNCRRRIGCENKLLGGFFWNDSSRKVLAFDDQVTAYFAACREYGTPLDKMLYRVTKKPSIKPDSRKGESIPDYIKRLTERIEADPSYAFEQHELYRTDQQLDEFLEECAEVNEHVKLSRRREAWPKSTKACTMFGGCSFLPVCRNEVGLEDQFRIRPLPAPKPKLPRLGKVQKAVLLALGDAFTSPIATSALAKQVAYAQPSVASALKSLQDRGFIADDGVIEGETYWDVMPEGRVVIDLLRGVSA